MFRSRHLPSFAARLGELRDRFDQRKRGSRPRIAEHRALALEVFEDRCLLTGASISGTVFRDPAGIGLSPGETPLAGATISLFQDVVNVSTPADNGVLDAGDPLVASRVTPIAGTYSFSGISPGRYFIAEQPPSGYSRTGGPAYYTIDVDAAGNVLSSSGTRIDNFSLPSSALSLGMESTDPLHTTYGVSDTFDSNILGGQRSVEVDDTLSSAGTIGLVSGGVGAGGGARRLHWHEWQRHALDQLQLSRRADQRPDRLDL